MPNRSAGVSLKAVPPEIQRENETCDFGEATRYYCAGGNCISVIEEGGAWQTQSNQPFLSIISDNQLKKKKSATAGGAISYWCWAIPRAAAPFQQATERD